MRRSTSPEKATIKDVPILLVAVLCLLISTVQTKKGYELAAGGEPQAWAISLIITTVLGSLYYQLRQKLKEGSFINTTVFSYLIVVPFSCVANFNAFYSEDMKEELLYNELEKLQGDLISIRTQATRALEIKSGAKDVEEKVNLLKSTLTQQILDPGAPGLGMKARQILKDLESVLGVKITEPAGESPLIAKSIERQIDGLLKIKIASMTDQSDILIDKIKSITDNLHSKIITAKSTKTLLDDSEVIEECIDAYNGIGEETEKTIGDPSTFSFKRIASESEEIGKISHSLNSAVQYKHRAAIIPALGLSLLIDLIVPAIITMLYFKTYKKRKELGIFTRRDERTQLRRKSLDDILKEEQNSE